MRRQRGFTLPETLASLAALGLLLSAFASLSLSRVETMQARAHEEEDRRLAGLVRQAHRRQRLAAGAAEPADLQKALPHASVPLQLPGGRDYTFAFDHDDPRILAGGATVRAPLPRSALRIPVWRARQLRQQRKADE